MQLRELTIERFRGIKSLTWRPLSPVVCLVGPGDSTKTTILDAIELVLGSRWAVSVLPTDFYGAVTDDPVQITATIGELPPALLDDDKYGLEIRGWSDEGLRDEPEPSDEPVLSVVFAVDSSLEPSWRIVNDRKPDGRSFPSRDRELLGLVRLGGEIDRHLSWTRGSALTRNTDDLKDVNRVIAAAHREARDAVADAPLEKLKTAATKAQAAAAKLGVRITTAYRPGLESGSVSMSVGQLTLHQGDIPVRAAGLGTRRLNALALQTLSVQSGAVLLVDEVEHGLEPYRLRHLLRELQKAPGTTGQVMLTTHSEIPLEELSSKSIYVVRCDEGTTSVLNVGVKLQNLARSNPEAFLARRVLVCEGKTEIGLCNALRPVWAEAHDNIPVACTGTTFALGNGTNAGTRSLGLKQLGYATGLLADSDRPTKPVADVIEKEGVDLFLWPGDVCTEVRVARDVPWASLQELVELAISHFGADSVIDAARDRLQKKSAVVGSDLNAWRANGISEVAIRNAIGEAAHAREWFKDIARGEALGSIVAGVLEQIPATPLAKTLKRVATWVYAD